ncbi:ATP-dependent helicase HrpB [Motiliproteus sp. MSK22-1]|uniref:ATP-dependent helicase HrpB n=1 Tax=Motiliproteus sp. MSK22-1 TaxID=1897630 RepID=UPI0009759605|nr:ATP-dependent helicase HrpB [Motiliproteus sp. MSK22-1]OMH38204.1 ATP-dependent helicase HrpB [Motiliproteus sp. MSK22-1]
MTTLPIEEKIPEILETLDAHTLCLLQASPGAGKTTRIPLALLGQSWLGEQKIILLEPRRIAARSAARYMAKLLNQPLAEDVGYRMRLDSRTGPNTRIEVVTEGILTRMIQADPSLEGVGCIIFDEFHERSLQADLGLALSLESQQLFREDLRILIMSATLDSTSVNNALGTDIPIISSDGRSFPVKTHYLGGRLAQFRISELVNDLCQIIAETSGSILCFLPGSGEIHRTLKALEQESLPDKLLLAPLFGALTPEQQDLAITPPPEGWRKLVLATDIAETSLTIDGVNVVVDTGLTRNPRFDPRSGMSTLITQRISQASAEQRRGRAGRQQAGHCYRLWSQEQEYQFESHAPAEILHADLASLALELSAWGAEASELCWLDAPPTAHLNQAHALLKQLGALDQDHKITPMGSSMITLGTHPRLAHMMLKSNDLGLARLGCDLAALLGERDLLSANHPTARNNQPLQKSADINLRLDQYYSAQDQLTNRKNQTNKNNHSLIQRIHATSSRWQRHLKPSTEQSTTRKLSHAGLLLCFAFPDRIAQQRSTDSLNYQLRNGKGAAFSHRDTLCQHPYIVAADLDGKGANARIYLAAPVDERDLLTHFRNQITDRTDVFWDSSSESVRARQRSSLGALVLTETPVPPSAEQLTQGLLSAIRQRGVEQIPWSKQAQNIRARISLIHRYTADATNSTEPQWPDMTDKYLEDRLETWLAPHLEGFRKLEQLKQLDFSQLLLNQLEWKQQQQLQQWLPSHYQVPSGSNISIDYLSREDPVLSVRIQELFGLQQTPTVLNGRIPLTLQLLSPAQRPIQLTNDLASFWRNTYAEVCKDLKGRYPKHYWPDNPLQAQATRTTKRKMESKETADHKK